MYLYLAKLDLVLSMQADNVKKTNYTAIAFRFQLERDRQVVSGIFLPKELDSHEDFSLSKFWYNKSPPFYLEDSI